MSDVMPLTPPVTPKHPHMTITNFNYEASYLPGVKCNIGFKADLGRWTPQGKEQRCLEYQYTKFGRQTYFCWWTPPWCPNTPEAPPKHCHTTITNFNYEGSYLPGVICNIVVKADLGRWTPWEIEKRCLEYWYTKFGRWTYFCWWTPQVNQA